MRVTCREVAENAGDLIDGELPLGSHLKTRAHLLICRDCRAHVDQLRRTIGLVAIAGARSAGEPNDALAIDLARRAAAARARQPRS